MDLLHYTESVLWPTKNHVLYLVIVSLPLLLFVRYLCQFFIDTGSYYIARAALKLVIVMPQRPECWDHMPRMTSIYFVVYNTGHILRTLLCTDTMQDLNKKFNIDTVKSIPTSSGVPRDSFDSILVENGARSHERIQTRLSWCIFVFSLNLRHLPNWLHLGVCACFTTLTFWKTSGQLFWRMCLYLELSVSPWLDWGQTCLDASRLTSLQ